jgi:large subunit ribosomal protein L21
MYAIVKTGGKQYRVERGQRLLIERLAVEEGADVALEPLLYRSDEAVFDRAGLDKVQVTAKVLAHVRGEKLRVFKFKPKRGYKRRNGHRQDLTRIEVTAITSDGTKALGETAKPVAAKASRAKPAGAGTPAPTAKSAEAAKTASPRAPKAKSTKAAKPTSARTPKAKSPEAAETTSAKPAESGKAKSPAAAKPKRPATRKPTGGETAKTKEKPEDGS